MKLKTEYIILVIVVGLTCFIISQKSNIEGLTTTARPTNSGSESKSSGGGGGGGSACSIM